MASESEKISGSVTAHIGELQQGIVEYERYVKDLEERAAAAAPKADEADKIDRDIMARRKELTDLEGKLIKVKDAHASFQKIANG